MIKIDEPGAFEALLFIEGEVWGAKQVKDRESHTGFYAYVEAWSKFERLRRFDPKTTKEVASFLPEGDGSIHGEWQRYRVLQSGEIALIRETVIPTATVEARVRKTNIRTVD